MSAKSRKDCFFGLHFDFHAMEGEAIGEIIQLDTIEKMLDATKPDMIQVDTKGHPGISSYRTKAGVHAPQMHMDVLKTWRELTKKRGIRLYAHHSGLYELTQARLHPDWAVVSADGEVSTEFLSPFSPYVDEVLIPQLLEIAGEYGADGAWVDGDCWGVKLDYSENAKNAWLKEKKIPVPYPGDENYEDYREFIRQGFRNYVAHYVDVLKKAYPDFEVTSNWMYSHLMPEKIEVPIDFISGDYDCRNSVRAARETGRCIANQEITWDLMAWGQNATPVDNWVTRNRCTKEGPQLCQEAAVILSQGGGFQFFNILYGTGGLVQEWAIDSWQEVADFCKARKEFCFHAESIADIGILYPMYYGNVTMFTGAACPALKGWISAVADAGFSCDVVNESDIKHLDRYRVIVLPAALKYKPETLELLKEYAKNGGILIADGGVNLDPQISGVQFVEGRHRLFFPDCGRRLTALESTFCEPELTTARPLLYCYENNYYHEPQKHISCAIHEFGKGKVASLCFDLGNVYTQNITYALKQYLKSLFAGCGYQSFISVEGSDYADMTLMQKNGHICVNIVNMAGEHNSGGVRTFREIPPVGPLKIVIRTDKAPQKVLWQPEGRELPLEKTADGYACTLCRLEIHGVAEIVF